MDLFLGHISHPSRVGPEPHRGYGTVLVAVAAYLTTLDRIRARSQP